MGPYIELSTRSLRRSRRPSKSISEESGFRFCRFVDRERNEILIEKKDGQK